MRDSGLTHLLRSVAIAGGVPAVVASAAMVATGRGPIWFSEFMAAIALLAAFFALFVWLVAVRQPRNLVVWLMAGSSLSAGWGVTGAAIVMALFPGGRAEWVSAAGMALLAPSELPPAAAWILFVSEPLVVSAIFVPVTLGLLLFPDGRLPSRRWRVVGLLAVVSTLGSVVAIAWNWRPWSNVPAGPLAVGVATVLFSLWLCAAVLSASALVVRLRRSSGGTRQQIKLIFWGGSIFGLALMTGGMVEGSRYGYVLETFAFQMLWTGALVVFLLSYGVAVAKYRLYDVDVVISRTVVYGTLAVSITVFYVAVVVGVGGLVGRGEAEPNPWLAIGATAVVALAFEPLRVRLNRFANRLVYGRRATPYQVLSEFSNRISAPDGTLLEQVARSLAEGTTAVRAELWLVDDGALVRSAVSPPDEEEPGPGRAADLNQIPAADLAQPVVHDGEVLGAITLSSPEGQTLLPSDERLLSQLASALGLALRNHQLHQDLRRRIEELRRSRQRIVAVQDETRRRLERDLHDGAQQRLVAIRVKLGLAERKAEKAGKARLADLLHDAATKTEHAIGTLRDFARGVHPPLLEAEGVGAAITSQTHRLPIPVTVHAPGIGRYPPAVEAAVYFCALEALQNVIKHAHATSAYVSLHDTGAGLSFEVSDDGIGFFRGNQQSGSGLANLTDRVDALDGTLDIVAAPGGGTTIRGEIPVSTLETAP